VIELSPLSDLRLHTDERYTVRLLSVDGGAILGTVVSRTLVLLASASPSGVMQLYFADSRHAIIAIVNLSLQHGLSHTFQPFITILCANDKLSLFGLVAKFVKQWSCSSCIAWSPRSTL